ncbi:hypothetical protein F511_27971 [Dorcoceras hygrometricum]|uniref:Uncharacterized protein n=1 Tax=Dorcoceras hygrometricum TaxID=472368 RepID=A0A2Z7BQF3_9LAMI|nr:hypothetical protein F511_27971 [Dorcoceras hygrometricum]
MPPRRRGRGRGQFQDESGGQNEDQHSFPSRGRGRRVEDEVDDLTTRVESMEIVMEAMSSKDDVITISSYQEVQDLESAMMTSAVISSQLADEESSVGALSKYGISREIQPAVDSADGSCNDGFSRGAKMKKRSAGMMRTSWYIKMVQLVPVGSDSTSRRKQQLIQSRASMNQLLLCIQSQDVVPVASKLQRYESSRSDEPAAKQLTIYEELSKLDVNC